MNEVILTVEIAEKWLENPHDGALLGFACAEEEAIRLLATHTTPPPPRAGTWQHPWDYMPRLSLGLSRVTDTTADQLSRFAGRLWLYQIQSLSEASELSLAKREWPTDLPDLQLLRTAALADHLGRLAYKKLEIANGWPGSLCGHLSDFVPQNLTRISDEAAAVLASHRDRPDEGFLKEYNLESISKSLAELLVTVDDDLELDSVASLSAETAAILARHQRHVSLIGLIELHADVADALSGFHGEALSLSGLTTLSDSAAISLAKFQGGVLYLKGLTTLSELVIENLRQLPAKVLWVSAEMSARMWPSDASTDVIES